MDDVRDRCRELMRDRSLTISGLAKELDVGRSSLSMWLRDREHHALPGVEKRVCEWLRRGGASADLECELGRAVIALLEVYQDEAGHPPRAGWLREIQLRYEAAAGLGSHERMQIWAELPRLVRAHFALRRRKR